ncbi:MAG: tripartite tricarboxylate transporter TctB family protein [Deltaproteobacteria bacterium]|nr:tripartite tricarboxylate transporter TctB family protein [Deltaproteobacteria bacterium]MBM4347635.1 tripartite tricarboxylate transporter TctB family protein [Deltaproteobacteria bacterium]
MSPILFAMGALAVLVGIGILVRFSGMRQHLGNILIPCCLIALSLVFLAITFRFSGEEEAGPAAIPRLWIFLILVLSSIILGQILRGKDEVVPRIKRTGLLALVMVTLISYFLAISYIGYFLSTFLFIVLLLNMLSYRKKLLIYFIAGGWILFSYLVFYKLLYIQLPLGFFEGLF